MEPGWGAVVWVLPLYGEATGRLRPNSGETDTGSILKLSGS